MKLGQTLGGLLNATWVAAASFVMRSDVASWCKSC